VKACAASSDGTTDLRRLLRECDVAIGSRLRVRELKVAQRSLNLQEAKDVEHIALLRCHTPHNTGWPARG
jgi:hypothetical protein